MHHAEMDLADRVGFVVQKADDAHFVIAIDFELFIEFALDCGVIGGCSRAALAHIHRIDVATDSDGEFRVEAVFPTGLAAGVVEHPIAAFKNAIRDELFVAGIVLRFRALQEKMAFLTEQNLHCVIGALGFEAFEHSDFLKQVTFHDQHFFTCIFWHARMLESSCAPGNPQIFTSLLDPARFSRKTRNPQMSDSEKKPRTKAAPFFMNGELVEPGARKVISFQAGTTMSNHPLSIDADIMHGKKPGPCLLITACLHGDEINGTEIIRRLLSSTVLKRLRGTLLTLPIVNFPAFTSRTRYLPDRRDLNRLFPGSESGSQGARLANALSKKFLPLCDAVIDLHTGAVNRPNLPQIRIAAGDEASLDLGKAFAAPVTMLSPLRPGTFREAAFKLGKPFVLFEGGEASRLDSASIRFGVQGITAAMRHLGMLPKSKFHPDRYAGVLSKSSHWERAPSGGLFIPLVALGKAVATGDILGLVAPPLGGGEGAPVLSTTNGIVIGRNNEGLADEGDALFHIASFADAGSVESQIRQSNEDLPNEIAEDVGHPVRYHPFVD